MVSGEISRLHRPWGAMAVHEWPGEEPAYLFLHGNGCAAEDWELVRPYLPGRAISMDFAGHGASDAPAAPFSIADLVEDTLALIAARQLSHLVLVGHSLGGMVGIEVAHRSRAIAALVLVEGWTGSAAWPAFDRSHHFGQLSDAAIAAIEATGRRMRERVQPALLDGYWQSVCDFDGYAMLEQLTIPVVEIYGTAGWQTDSRATLLIPETPCIQLRWIDGAGHFLLHERQAEVAHICCETRAMITQ